MPMLRELFSFHGRIGRTAFVAIQVGVLLAAYLAMFIFIIAVGAGDETRAAVTAETVRGAQLGAAVFAVAALWVSLAAAVKRCHDRGLSGWMLLFVFPPVLGQLWLVLSLVTGEGQAGANRYGVRRPLIAINPALSLAPA